LCHFYPATTHRNHAVEIGQSLQIQNFRAAATISGDGVFHEFMNGILMRPDWKESSKLPLGIIGSGTSNALGQNLDVAQQPLAVLALLKGRTQKMDVLSIMQENVVSYSHLMVAWTLIADVDIESERFRKLGPLRMAIMVLIRLMNFRKYRGKLFLLPDDTDLEKYKTKDLPGAESTYLGIEA
jgi:sphingosine kinase